MSIRSVTRLCARSALCVLGLATSASPQCLDWKPGFGLGGPDSVVRALVVFDDGQGPALYAGGDFTSAGGLPASRVAKWTGLSWSPLGEGVNSTVEDLVVYDDGQGAALYVAGTFTQAGGIPVNGIARWDGTGWSPLGSGLTTASASGTVRALEVFDDGQGPGLYAAGSFTFAGGQTATSIARWDGSSWSPVGSGFDPDDYVLFDLQTFDDGSGPALFIALRYQTYPFASGGRVVRWDGASYTFIGVFYCVNGCFAEIEALGVFDDGGGARLYAGGVFSLASGTSASNVARWDGASSWSALGSGIAGSVDVLHAFDDGSGPALYAGGLFQNASGSPANGVAKWDGASWSPLGSGLDGSPLSESAEALAVFDDGSGPALYVGGYFETAGGVDAPFLATWKAGVWSASSASTPQGLDSYVLELSVWDDGSGPALYAGGTFTKAGGVPASQIARWDGASWSALGSGLDDDVHALAAFDDGSGSALFAGGYFQLAGGISTSGLARWDGTSWSSIGSVQGNVAGLAVFDDGQGPALFVGGGFQSVAGVPASNIARWDGASWSAVGGGTDYSVQHFAVFDDGAGPALYAGGSFTQAGGLPAARIARWDGTSWSALGSGTTAGIYALAVFDDGQGLALYAGGGFSSAGGLPAMGIARWDGSSWTDVGGGVDDTVLDLAVFDDGAGPALYAAGEFAHAGVFLVNHVAKWNGAIWSTLAGGTTGGLSGGDSVFALEVFDDGAQGGTDLYAGGGFTLAGDVASSRIAQWRGCAGPGALFCFGYDSATACPCANAGAPMHGCENSSATGGALLSSTGSTTPDTLVLTSSGEPPSALSIFLQGDAEIAPIAFGDGLRCVGGNLKRLYVAHASGGIAEAPDFAAGDPTITQQSANLGDPIASGTTRSYQVYYRDPDLAFCPSPPGNSWNVSNGVRVTW